MNLGREGEAGHMIIILGRRGKGRGKRQAEQKKERAGLRMVVKMWIHDP